MYKLLVFVRVFALRTFVGRESWSRIWLAALDDKPAGGCANLFHRLLIPPSLNPSNSFFFPSIFLSIVPVWTARFYHGYSNTGRGCGRLPNTPNASNHTHTHIDLLSRAKFHQKALLAWLARSCCPFTWDVPSSSGPHAARPRWNRTAAVQPPCNRPTHPGCPPAHVESLLGWRYRQSGGRESHVH